MTLAQQPSPEVTPKSTLESELAIFSGNANPDLARSICECLGVTLGHCMVSRFSEGEIRVKIDDNVRGKDVFLIQPTCPPTNDNLMELLILIDAVRRASARRITAVIPYYGYARQDRKDQPRVPITAKLVANLITTAGANRVLTMDLHAGQIQGFFDIPLDHLYAVTVFEEYIRQKQLSPLVVVSPDVGGIKMARAYAKRLGAELAIVDKRRMTPESIEVMHILGEARGKHCLLVDDLIATGSSMAEAAQALKHAGAKAIYGAVTHPILSGPAIDRVLKSPLQELIVTDTVPLSDGQHRPLSIIKPPRQAGQGVVATALDGRISVVSVARLFCEAIRRIHFEQSISSLFDGMPG